MVAGLERLRAVLVERYAIDCELGRGGMATVYLAQDLKHGRPVAIKVLRPDLAETLGSGRFLREIRIASRLVHPNILPVHDSGTADGLLFYVTPYVAGESLRERIRREGPLPLRDAIRITREVAEALAYAHGQDVVHRDIKPGNILLEAGHAVIADFGLARAIHAAVGDDVSSAGLAIGTPPYMSPEQATGGDQIDGRSDLYSLGCVFYEMLAGEPPFTGPSAQAIAAKHLQLLPPALRTVRPHIPPLIEAAIGRALEKVPADRFQSAEDFARALTVEERSTTQRIEDRLSVRGLVAAGLAAGLIVLALVLAIRWRSSVTPHPQLGIVLLPFQGSVPAADLSGNGRPAPHLLLADALEWIPGLRAIDGSQLVGAGHGTRAVPLQELLRGAKRLGGRYLLTGSSLPAGGGMRVSIELYSTDNGERIMRAVDSAPGTVLDTPIGRLAIQSVNVLASREGLDLGASRTILAATTSATAVGQLLEAYSRFRLGDLDAAAAALRSAIEADSSCGLAYHRLSVIQTLLHDDSSALAAVDAGLARSNVLDRQSLARLKAQRHFVLGYGDSAIAAFQDAVLDDQTDIDAWYGLGEALFHFGAFAAHSPLDARAALDRVAALDTSLTPVYDHLLELALQADDRRGAEGYLRRLRLDDPWRPMREALVAIQFRSGRDRSAALSRLQGMERPALSQVVISVMHGGRKPALADTVAGFFLGANRTPDDRRRGGQYRLVALAAQGHWIDAVSAWRAAAGDESFDAWVVQAALADYQAADLAEPMFAWARRQVTAGRSPDFRRPYWDEVRQSFDALVDRATLAGDSAEVTDLLRRIERAPTRTPTDPGPETLRASLRARLALLAGDTTRATGLLQRAVSRIAEPWTANFPLTAMGPQRYLLAELLRTRGDSSQARRWQDSFSNSWAITDVLYLARMGRLERRPAN
jgi:tetratricopeptide (TPR) repeat protein